MSSPGIPRVSTGLADLTLRVPQTSSNSNLLDNLVSPPLTAGIKTKVWKRKSDSVTDPSSSTSLKKFASADDQRSPDEQPSTSAASTPWPVHEDTMEEEDENPSITSWIDEYHRFSRTDRLDALHSLMSSCTLNEVRNVSETIAPFFQKDFLKLLPKEISVHILQQLSPKDLISCAAVNRVWRTISEDTMLWREHCYENDFVADTTSGSTKGPLYSRSMWKSTYLRHAKVNNNWRTRPMNLIAGGAASPLPFTGNSANVIKTHEEHVITCLQVDDDYIVSGSDDNSLRVYNAQTGVLIHTLSQHTGGVWSSVLAVKLGVVISGSTDRMVRVWDLKTGACKFELRGHTSTVRCMTMHGEILVTGSRDATLRAWNVTTGECLHVLSGHGTAVRCVAFDGDRIVSGSYDSTLRVWSLSPSPLMDTTYTCLHTLHGHLNRVYSLLLDGKRNLVVSGSLDTTIRIWDISDGKMLHVLIGHTSLTSGMALHGDRQLVSGNADNTVRVWDITDGSCVHVLSRHDAAVTSLTLLSNGLLVTSSDDGSAKLWDVNAGTYIRDLIRLSTCQQGGCIWRLKATPSRLVCAAGSRNQVEDTKLIVLDFTAEYP